MRHVEALVARGASACANDAVKFPGSSCAASFFFSPPQKNLFVRANIAHHPPEARKAAAAETPSLNPSFQAPSMVSQAVGIVLVVLFLSIGLGFVAFLAKRQVRRFANVLLDDRVQRRRERGQPEPEAAESEAAAPATST
ncbi:hypothetical protein CDD83_3753 [Cordyceps sp. RAO-2017]|nr:hypothetical protein CDD83_3753 [Cordyceps sp. RAO-2017]